MNLLKIEFLKERNKCISSFIRSASCSSGWLRFVVQIICGTLIVASFVLIVLMALGRSQKLDEPVPKCTTTSNCRVICNEVPYYSRNEDDIINAVSEVDPNCESIALKLNRPTFENSEIPQQWLSRIRFNVRELAIIGGNAKHISSGTFMTLLGANLITLILEKIEIKWDNSMLVGLSDLKNIYIKDCYLEDIREKALGAVRDSLEMLDIKSSNSFNPINITGSADLKFLTVVEFSNNDFNNILGPLSFTELKYCKRLFLNFCQITAIRPGTFDHLKRIEELHLNNNNLITVPVGLFNSLIPLKPQIDLHANKWHCACAIKDLRTMLQLGLLVVDPICRYPDEIKGMTFSRFGEYCNGTTLEKPTVSDSWEGKESYEDICKSMTRIIYLNTSCSVKNSSHSSELRVKSSGPQKCYLNRIINDEIPHTNIENEKYEASDAWIKPVYSVQRNPYSMIEMQSSEQPGLGLLWYHSLCSREVFCTNTIPNVLKVFNIGKEMRYTFCPFSLSNGTVLNKHCVTYKFFEKPPKVNAKSNSLDLLFYILISLGCLLCGALFVYALIQRNPTLLKGNKRVLLVKHRSIDALILPPRLPLRKEFMKESKTLESSVSETNKIFLLSDNLEKLSSSNFIRSISSKSSESNDASYISAIQPSEEQLREWHSNQTGRQIDNGSLSDGDISPFSSMYERESLPYYSIYTSERFYEVPKQY